MNEIEFCFDASSRKSGNRTVRAGVPLSNFATLDDNVGIAPDAPAVLMTEAPSTMITETPATQISHPPGIVINENPNELAATIDSETVDHTNEVYVL